MILGIIPDVHQTTLFIDMLNNNIKHVDKMIFLGDYVDHWYSELWWNNPEHNPINIINKIVSYKNKYPNKIDLLLGNHDLSYISSNPNSKKVSGHQHNHDKEIAEILLQNIKLFKIAVEYDGWVLSHAGFSNTWVNNQKEKGWNNKKSIIDWCNKMIQKQNFHYFDWTGNLSASGNEITQTPTWIRPFALAKDAYFKNQIVGHSEAYYAPIFVKHKSIHLVLVDSPEHTAYVEFDTNKIPKFETAYTVLQNIKEKRNQIKESIYKNSTKIIKNI